MNKNTEKHARRGTIRQSHDYNIARVLPIRAVAAILIAQAVCSCSCSRSQAIVFFTPSL
jgi:hypothetical protein